MKKVTVTKAKKHCWEAFSRYIRLRDALKTTGTKEYLLCITCGKRYPAFGVGCAQAGHFMPGRKNSILIDEKFVHGQCPICNIWLKGNWVVYEQKMIEMWGKDEVEKVKLRHWEVTPRKAFEWLEIEAEYKSKYEQLLQERG